MISEWLCSKYVYFKHKDNKHVFPIQEVESTDICGQMQGVEVKSCQKKIHSRKDTWIRLIYLRTVTKYFDFVTSHLEVLFTRTPFQLTQVGGQRNTHFDEWTGWQQELRVPERRWKLLLTHQMSFCPLCLSCVAPLRLMVAQWTSCLFDRLSEQAVEKILLFFFGNDYYHALSLKVIAVEVKGPIFSNLASLSACRPTGTVIDDSELNWTGAAQCNRARLQSQNAGVSHFFLHWLTNFVFFLPQPNTKV